MTDSNGEYSGTVLLADVRNKEFFVDVDSGLIARYWFSPLADLNCRQRDEDDTAIFLMTMPIHRRLASLRMGCNWKGLVGAGWEGLGMGMMVRDGLNWDRMGWERLDWARRDRLC